MKRRQITWGITGLFSLAVAGSVSAQNRLVDPSFENNPLDDFMQVLGNWDAGVWGVERATIIGPDWPVIPPDGDRMLRMTDDGLVATQAFQITDIRACSDRIDAGLVAFHLEALFNANVPAAAAGIRLHFFADDVWGPAPGVGNSRVLDSDPTTWESLSVRGVIPSGTRWLVTELLYVNATIRPDAGYVDRASLYLGTASWDLLTVANTNELMRVDLSTGPAYSATAIGVTQDADGTVRRIRGLAFVGKDLYGMTREGDLVEVDVATGETRWRHSVAGAGQQFWSGLTHRVEAGDDILYTVNAFGDQSLVRINLGPPTTHTVQGPTTSPFGRRQMLGVAFMDVGGETKLLASNRTNDNIVDMDPATGSFAFTWGNATSGVTNAQQIGVHPETGVLWAIHDHSRDAVLSTFNDKFRSTKMGILPFGIIESVGGGNDTYGWGGVEFDWAIRICHADVNCDGVVNVDDFDIFLDWWKNGDPRADWNGDGVINTLDFVDFQNDWAAGCK